MLNSTVKFYVVKEGVVLGLYTSWSICKRQVKGTEKLYSRVSKSHEAAVDFLASRA